MDSGNRNNFFGYDSGRYKYSGDDLIGVGTKALHGDKDADSTLAKESCGVGNNVFANYIKLENSTGFGHNTGKNLVDGNNVHLWGYNIQARGDNDSNYLNICNAIEADLGNDSRVSMNRLILSGLPTAESDAVSGELWNDNGTLKIKP